MMDFGDINGATAMPQLPIPPELSRLLRRGAIREAEAWIHKHIEHPWLQPHRVTLYVQENQFSVDLKPVTYFIRCPRVPDGVDANEVQHIRVLDAAGRPKTMPLHPSAAAEISDGLWQQWEKPLPVVGESPSPWPDTVDQADIIEIDEGDWLEYLRSAHKHSKKDTYHCAGPPKFPLYWTCTGLAFVDDQEAHDHPDYDILNAFAGNPAMNTRGGVVE